MVSKWYWLTLVLALGVTVTGYFQPVHQDEKVFLAVAKAITVGKYPYKDIADNKPPGIYYLLALGYRVFGEGKWYRVFVIISNIVSAWFIGKLTKSWIMPAIFFILLPYYQGEFALTEVFMLPWLLGSTLYLMKPNQTFVAGLWLGMAFLFKQTALVNLLAGLMVVPRKDISKLFLGFCVMPILAYGLMAIKVSPEVINDNVGLNLIMSYTPVPVLETLKQLPALVWPLSIFIILLLDTIYMRYIRNGLVYYSIMVCLLAIPLLLYRPYHHYWIQFLPYLLIASAGSPMSVFLIDHDRGVIKPLPKLSKS